MSLQDQVNFEVSPWHLVLPYITHLTHCVALVKFKFKNCKVQIKKNIERSLYFFYLYLLYFRDWGERGDKNYTQTEFVCGQLPYRSILLSSQLENYECGSIWNRFNYTLNQRGHFLHLIKITLAIKNIKDLK